MHLTDLCRFLNCSVRMGGRGGAVQYEFMRGDATYNSSGGGR
jgi:hypothetical protein